MKLIQTQTVPLQFKLTFSIFTIIPGITQGRSSLFQPIHNTLYIQEDAVSWCTPFLYSFLGGSYHHVCGDSCQYILYFIFYLFFTRSSIQPACNQWMIVTLPNTIPDGKLFRKHILTGDLLFAVWLPPLHNIWKTNIFLAPSFLCTFLVADSFRHFFMCISCFASSFRSMFI